MKNHITLSVFTLAFQALFTGGCIIVLFVLIPFWQQTSPDVFLQWFGNYAKFLGLTMLPLEVFPLITAMIAYIIAFKNKQNNKNLWLLANVSNLLIVAAFIAYFMPANSALLSGTVASENVATSISEWKNWHILRTVLAGLSTLFCCLAIIKE